MDRRDDDRVETTSVSGGTDSWDKLILQVVVHGSVVEFDLHQGSSYSVGRAPRAEIQIASSSISRFHASLQVDGDQVLVNDTNSRNGTRVRGRRIGDEPVPVRVGDSIRFGDIVAHLQGGRSRHLLEQSFATAAGFQVRLANEAERCVRYDRPISAIAVSTRETDDATLAIAKEILFASLRPLDAATMREPGRFDLLIVECPRDEASEIAERIHADFDARGVEVRVGVASYPTDVTSVDSLLFAADLAKRSATRSQVAQARRGTRVIKLNNREVVIGEPSMVRLFGLIERVASSDISALIMGETGTGKEIVAEALHLLGPRAAHRLVKINCAAMPETLLESELFGYEKGAFSGADTARPGLLVEASGGTILLDEIGEMPPALQAKLLRVLEDRRVRPVGATKEVQVDVRVVAATHRDLKTFAATGGFRQDLFYRLSGVILSVPPLRERVREIPLLAERFLAEARQNSGDGPMSITDAAMEVLCARRWPGNLRELRNAVHSAALLCGDRAIRPEHLPPETGEEPARADDASAAAPVADADEEPRSRSLESEVRSLERKRIVEALEHCGGNQTKAAEFLQMPRRTLINKIAALDIPVPRRRRRRRR